MKHRISITLEEETLLKLKERLREKGIMNQSLFVEEAIEEKLEAEA